MKKTTIILLSMATATLLNATGGGIVAIDKPTLSALTKDLKEYETRLKKDRIFINSNVFNQKVFLGLLTETNKYLDEYTKERSSCFTLEDKLKMNPPKYKEAKKDREDDIKDCYIRVNKALQNNSLIIANVKKIYRKMEIMKERVQGKKDNIQELATSVARVKSSILMMEKNEELTNEKK